MKQDILDEWCQAMNMEESNPWGTGNKLSPATVPAYCLKRVSRSQHKEGKSGWDPSTFQSWKDITQEIKMAVEYRGKSCMQREAQRSSEALPQVFSIRMRACMWVKDQRLGKGSSERITVNCAGCTHRTRINACSYQPERGKSWFMRHRVEYLENSFLSRFRK